jgi:hypothetical protein
MAHNFSDWCTPTYMEALPLLRAIDGEGVHQGVDQIWMESILKSLGPDGLFYFPITGKPWYGKELWWAKGIARADGTIFETEPADEKFVKSLDTYAAPHAHPMIEKSGMTQFSHPQPCGRVLNVLNIYYMIDGNPIWKKAIENMIDRLLELAVHKDDYCFFPPFLYEPNAKYDPTDPRVVRLSGVADGEINGRSIKGPALFYKMTGYEPARELAQKLTNYMRYQSNYYGSNGEFLLDKHFHGHTN